MCCLLFVAIILPVEVHGSANIALPQHSLNRLWSNLPFVHQPRAQAVPQIVKTEALPFLCGYEAFESFGFCRDLRRVWAKVDRLLDRQIELPVRLSPKSLGSHPATESGPDKMEVCWFSLHSVNSVHGDLTESLILPVYWGKKAASRRIVLPVKLPCSCLRIATPC